MRSGNIWDVWVHRSWGGSFVSRRQRTDVLPQSPITHPSYKHTNTLLTFKVPADTARTKSEHTHDMTRNALRCSEKRKAGPGECTSMTIGTSPHNVSVVSYQEQQQHAGCGNNSWHVALDEPRLKNEISARKTESVKTVLTWCIWFNFVYFWIKAIKTKIQRMTC